MEVDLVCKDFVNRVCLLAGTVGEEGAACVAISMGLFAATEKKCTTFSFVNGNLL